MTPYFSIITPTLQRESLVDTYKSIASQTFVRWEMLIQVDDDAIDEYAFARIGPTRKVWVESCGVRHNDGGNTCRREALKRATGEYVWFVDDDNTVADDRVLEDMAKALEDAGKPPWALFPVTRLGHHFYTDPPRSCHVDTMNFVLRRDIAYWPDTNAYGSDGILVDDVMSRKIPYAAFPNFRPIGIIPKISFCK
jgi:glycosyltransferase involved in cell wall biosynthesis